MDPSPGEEAGSQAALVIHVRPRAVSGQSWGGISRRSGFVLQALRLPLHRSEFLTTTSLHKPLRPLPNSCFSSSSFLIGSLKTKHFLASFRKLPTYRPRSSRALSSKARGDPQPFGSALTRKLDHAARGMPRQSASPLSVRGAGRTVLEAREPEVV